MGLLRSGERPSGKEGIQKLSLYACFPKTLPPLALWSALYNRHLHIWKSAPAQRIELSPLPAVSKTNRCGKKPTRQTRNPKAWEESVSEDWPTRSWKASRLLRFGLTQLPVLHAWAAWNSTLNSVQVNQKKGPHQHQANVLGESPLQFHEKSEHYSYCGSKGNNALQQRQERERL